MSEKGKQTPQKTEIAVAMAVSGIELSLYIIMPIFAGYLIGREFGTLGVVAGLFLGALLGLVLAVRRAIKMTL